VIKCGKLSYLEGTKFKSPIDCNDWVVYTARHDAVTLSSHALRFVTYAHPATVNSMLV
jgi:hypothetical protein